MITLNWGGDIISLSGTGTCSCSCTSACCTCSSSDPTPEENLKDFANGYNAASKSTFSGVSSPTPTPNKLF